VGNTTDLWPSKSSLTSSPLYGTAGLHGYMMRQPQFRKMKKKKSQAYGLARATASAQFPHRLIQKSREADLVIGRMKTDIFRPYSIRNPFLFKMIQIHLNPSLYIRHPILYSYPNIVYLWYWYPIVSCPIWLILSVFKFESEHKYENKYDINNICSYLIRFHL